MTDRRPDPTAALQVHTDGTVVLSCEINDAPGIYPLVFTPVGNGHWELTTARVGTHALTPAQIAALGFALRHYSERRA